MDRICHAQTGAEWWRCRTDPNVLCRTPCLGSFTSMGPRQSSRLRATRSFPGLLRKLLYSRPARGVSGNPGRRHEGVPSGPGGPPSNSHRRFPGLTGGQRSGPCAFCSDRWFVNPFLFRWTWMRSRCVLRNRANPPPRWDQLIGIAGLGRFAVPRWACVLMQINGENSCGSDFSFRDILHTATTFGQDRGLGQGARYRRRGMASDVVVPAYLRLD